MKNVINTKTVGNITYITRKFSENGYTYNDVLEKTMEYNKVEVVSCDGENRCEIYYYNTAIMENITVNAFLNADLEYAKKCLWRKCNYEE